MKKMPLTTGFIAEARYPTWHSPLNDKDSHVQIPDWGARQRGAVPLPLPLRRKRVHQILHREVRRLQADHDCLDDVGGEKGQSHQPPDVGRSDVLGFCQINDRGVITVLQHALGKKDPRTVRRFIG